MSSRIILKVLVRGTQAIFNFLLLYYSWWVISSLTILFTGKPIKLAGWYPDFEKPQIRLPIHGLAGFTEPVYYPDSLATFREIRGNIPFN